MVGSITKYSQPTQLRRPLFTRHHRDFLSGDGLIFFIVLGHGHGMRCSSLAYVLLMYSSSLGRFTRNRSDVPYVALGSFKKNWRSDIPFVAHLFALRETFFFTIWADFPKSESTFYQLPVWKWEKLYCRCLASHGKSAVKYIQIRLQMLYFNIFLNFVLPIFKVDL